MYKYMFWASLTEFVWKFSILMWSTFYLLKSFLQHQHFFFFFTKFTNINKTHSFIKRVLLGENSASALHLKAGVQHPEQRTPDTPAAPVITVNKNRWWKASALQLCVCCVPGELTPLYPTTLLIFPQDLCRSTHPISWVCWCAANALSPGASLPASLAD